MIKKLSLAIGLFLLASLLFNIQAVSAHTTVPVGKYAVEIGWVDEPPIVGQRNAIVVNVASADTNVTPTPDGSSTTDAKPAQIDVSGLVVQVVYGGESKTLTLQPLSEDSIGQYIAPILPARPGVYTVRLSGKLGDEANVKAEVQPEEVKPADELQFPTTANTQSQTGSMGLTGWLAIAALIFGVAGLVVAGIALQKSR